jgi:hypothetical protein
MDYRFRVGQIHTLHLCTEYETQLAELINNALLPYDDDNWEFMDIKYAVTEKVEGLLFSALVIMKARVNLK